MIFFILWREYKYKLFESLLLLLFGVIILKLFNKPHYKDYEEKKDNTVNISQYRLINIAISTCLFIFGTYLSVLSLDLFLYLFKDFMTLHIFFRKFFIITLSFIVSFLLQIPMLCYLFYFFSYKTFSKR